MSKHGKSLTQSVLCGWEGSYSDLIFVRFIYRDQTSISMELFYSKPRNLNGFILSRYACISCYDQIKCSGKRLPKSAGLLCSALALFLFFAPFSWYALQKNQALLERVYKFLNSVWYSLMDCLWGPQCSCDCSILKRVVKLPPSATMK